MARFRIFMIGSAHAPLIESAANDLHELGQMMSCNRFLEGEIVDAANDVDVSRVLISTSRIQMVAEAA